MMTNDEPITKDEWIQLAKSLLFDCTSCVDSNGIIAEIEELIRLGGGYDYKTETPQSKLRWDGA